MREGSEALGAGSTVDQGGETYWLRLEGSSWREERDDGLRLRLGLGLRWLKMALEERRWWMEMGAEGDVMGGREVGEERERVKSTRGG